MSFSINHEVYLSESEHYLYQTNTELNKPALIMDSKDQFKTQLTSIIELLQEYQPGKINRENVENLCQILGLETFVDNLSANSGTRLSIASKIIVIDIDFDNTIDHIVKDAKLVLASNFDNFNYYNEDNHNNILFNSLSSKYNNLSVFTKNLKFLKLLDSYSKTSMDEYTDDSNENGEALAKEVSDINMINTGESALMNDKKSNSSSTISADSSNELTSGTHSRSGSTNRMSMSLANSPGSRAHLAKLKMGKNSRSFDLFRYYTNLKDYLVHYLKDFEPYIKITSNVNDEFGIYFQNKITNVSIMKLRIEETKITKIQQSLLEFQFVNEQWICQNPTKVIDGLSLIVDILDTSLLFADHVVPSELILDVSAEQTLDTPFALPESFVNPFKQQVQMAFTSKFSKINKINVTNENLNCLKDMVEWSLWYDMALVPSFKKYIGIINSFKSHSKPITAAPIISGSMRKPSMSIMKEEGITQLNMHDLLKPELTEDGEIMMDDGDSVAITTPTEELGSVKQEDAIMGEDKQQPKTSSLPPNIVISEDYIYEQGKGSVTFYEIDFFKWSIFTS